MKIEDIHYEFDPDAVLAGIETDIYDFDASVARYIELCGSALRQAYHGAIVRTRKAYGARTQYLVNGLDDHSEISAIEGVCNEIWYAEDDYKVKILDITSIRDAEQSVSIEAIYEEFGTTMGLLRWCCKNDLIDEANRTGLVWVLTRRNFFNFQRTFLRGDSGATIWKIKQVGERVASITGVDHTEFLEQKIVDTFADGIMVLITSDRFELPTPFNKYTSYILVSNDQKQNLITITLFDDVARWENSSDHIFLKFRDSLYKWARSHNQYKVRKVEENVGKKEYSVAVDFVIEDEQENLRTYINKQIEKLQKLIEDVEIELAGGLPWNEKYERDEYPFQDYLKKLVIRMEYDIVKLEHGSFEFGKDIVFAESTKFGIRRFYAIQAKKGDLSGDAKSAIDEILTQMEDAFTVPFREQQTFEHKYISAFIIAISGEFTHNAKEKIWARLLRQGRIGLVYFWDKNVVQDLMRMRSLHNRKLSEHVQQGMMPDFLNKNQERR